MELEEDDGTEEFGEGDVDDISTGTNLLVNQLFHHFYHSKRNLKKTSISYARNLNESPQYTGKNSVPVQRFNCVFKQSINNYA